MRKYFFIVVLVLLTICSFAEKVADLPEILKPDSITTDGQNLFIVQEFSVYNYSLKTFKLQAKFAERGQGPGEIIENPYIRVLPDSVLVYSNGKCIWFSKGGTLLKEWIIQRENTRIIPTKDGFISSRFLPNPMKRTINIGFFLLDKKMNLKKEFYREPWDVNVSWEGGEAGFKEWRMLNHFIGVDYDGEKIFVANSAKGFFINVYNLNGEPLYTIQKDNEIEKVKVDDEFKKEAIEEFKIVEKRVYVHLGKSDITFYKYFPPIRDFFVNGGKIYVITFKKQDNKHEVIVLNQKGKILKRAMLPLMGLRAYVRPGLVDPVTIRDGKVYEVVENENTEMHELYIHDIK